MIFFYIRHGDPIYDPDLLTPLGERQAEAVGKRLALYGVDKIYASTSNRAILTSRPTCELLHKEAELLDFCNERYVWDEFTVIKDGVKKWLFHDEETRQLFTEPEIISLGFKWYEHPQFTTHKAGVDRVYDEADKLFLSLGYEHIRGTGKYKVVKPNDERAALFAHQGFGLTFLSTILDIPYPVFATHFDMCHSGMTAIEFKEENGFAIPRVMTLSSDSHIYKEGLPTNYNNAIRF